MSSSKNKALKPNDEGNDYGPQSRQKGSTPNAGPMSTPTSRTTQGGVARSAPKPVRHEPKRNFQEVAQVQERRGGQQQSQFVDKTLIRRRQGNDSSETESDSDHDKREEVTRSQRGSDARRQVPREMKYHSGAQQESSKEREEFFRDQLQLMAEELTRVRMDNLNLTRVSSQQQAELNAYADQEFSAQYRVMGGDMRSKNIPRSGGPSRFDGVDPQYVYDTSITAYDVNDANTSYYLAPLSSKDLGTPWKSLELHIKGRISQKSVLSSDINSFEPWKTYITSILNSAWLTCLAKMNIYQIPKRDKWAEWDEKCIKGRSPNVSRAIYHNIMQQVDKQVPVIGYKDQYGTDKTFSTSTHVDIMNTVILAVNAKHGGQLMFSLCNILTNSIDPKSLRSVLNLERVADVTNLRETFFAALRYHENNSDTIIAYKMNKFTSTTEYKMVQSESPLGYLKRLQEEAVYINSMAPTGEASPITDRMLRNKFLSGVKQIEYLKPVTVTYDLGYVDNNGEPKQYTIERYATLLEKVYAEKKDKAAISSRDFHHHSGPRGFSVQEEVPDCDDFEQGMSLHEGRDEKSSPVCFAFRDTGVCKFGKTCKYPHVKASSQSKFQHKANATQVLEQYVVNMEHEHALKFQEYKKKLHKRFERKMFLKKKDKMKPYKKKLDEQNQRFANSDKANLAEEDVFVEKAEVAKVEDKEEEVSISDGSDLSTSDSDGEDQ